MQDTFQWTDELVQEFVQFTLHNSPVFQGRYKDMEQFKSSKSPKKEWEIVAFGEYFDGRILLYKLQESGFYRNVDDDCEIEYEARQFNNNNEFIHSVRRLSDGEVFSVGDRLQNYTSPITEITTKGWVDGIGFNCGEYGEGCSISRAKKLPQPILTTVDGVEIRENEECWIVDKYYKLLPEPEKINEFKRNYYSNCFIFSTREAAEEYILNNRPLLSLNDVKNYVKAGESASFAIEKLTALVRQKLNQ